MGMAMGSWCIISKLDPRWNASGRCEVGMFGMPQEAQQKLELNKKELGEVPSDLSFSYMKD